MQRANSSVQNLWRLRSYLVLKALMVLIAMSVINGQLITPVDLKVAGIQVAEYVIPG